MSGEFLTLDEIEPLPSDQLLFVRDRTGKRATVANLQVALTGEISAAIAFSKTPPTDKALWWQLDESDRPVEFWLLRPGGVWVSERRYVEAAFEYDVKNNYAYIRGVSVPGSSVWFDSLSARAVVSDTMTTDYIDFQLALINGAQQSTPLYYLRLAGAKAGDIFTASEHIGLVKQKSEAMALALNIFRSGKTTLKTASIAVSMRRVYAPGN